MASQEEQEQQWAANLKKALRKNTQHTSDSLDEQKQTLQDNMSTEIRTLRSLLQKQVPQDVIASQVHTLIELRASQLALLIETVRLQGMPTDPEHIMPYINTYYTHCYRLVHAIETHYGRK